MKKHVPIAFIFLLFLSIISFHLIRNAEITQKIQNYSEIRQVGYELKILLHKYNEELGHFDKDDGYSQVVNSYQMFLKSFEFFEGIVKNTHNTKLLNLLKDIDKKNLIVKKVYKNKSQLILVEQPRDYLCKRNKKYICNAKA